MTRFSQTLINNALFLMACSFQASHVSRIWKFNIPEGLDYWLVEVLRIENEIDNKAYGYVIENEDTIIVAFKDSNLTLFDVAMDLNIYQVPFKLVPSGGKTHEGFTYAYLSLREGLISTLKELYKKSPGKTLFLTGHSSGGALATLAGVDIAVNTSFKSPKVYTSAAPRVGNPQFVETYNRLVKESIRIVNVHDIIPLEPHVNFPPSFSKEELQYRHVGKVLPLQFQCKGKNNMEDVPLLKNHNLQNYFNVLRKKNNSFVVNMCKKNPGFCPKLTNDTCGKSAAASVSLMRKT